MSDPKIDPLFLHAGILGRCGSANAKISLAIVQLWGMLSRKLPIRRDSLQDRKHTQTLKLGQKKSKTQKMFFWSIFGVVLPYFACGGVSYSIEGQVFATQTSDFLDCSVSEKGVGALSYPCALPKSRNSRILYRMTPSKLTKLE